MYNHAAAGGPNNWPPPGGPSAHSPRGLPGGGTASAELNQRIALAHGTHPYHHPVHAPGSAPAAPPSTPAARFRAKKKQHVETVERSIRDLEQQHRELEIEVNDLRKENGLLKEMVQLKYGARQP
ncbi:uncharacterized protein LOC62_02G002346 [Vanrija pseudolonga]|uniref:BZIP domain-containing protein n=1 Tax=Vanrija pseudolonga TaxID=143232 RepID=A0AAF1BP34_9TREE|nr:hypothetical protein LOC62_02G002346 [Vanrija pseudolonga]